MKRISILLLVLFTFLASAAWPQAQPQWTQKIIKFDAPHAGKGAGQGTLALDINPRGTITGWYVDANNVNHGFLRAREGTITEFNVPGAGTGAGQGTLAFDIDPRGPITGYYVDAKNAIHGFLRMP